MQYVELWGVDKSGEPVCQGRIYLVDGKLQAMPEAPITHRVMANPIIVRGEDGLEQVYINEPERFLNGLAGYYSGSYFHATKVLDDPRQFHEILAAPQV